MSDKFQNRYRIQTSRLQNWDYRKNASIFVTICTAGHEQFFGSILEMKMTLSEIGKIAQQYWHEIPLHFPSVRLDAFVVMPNHIHGIIIIDNQNTMNNTTTRKMVDDTGTINANSMDMVDVMDVETLHATSLQSSSQSSLQSSLQSSSQPLSPPTNPKNEQMAAISPKSGSLSAIIRSYKSVVTKNARQINPNFAWQSRYYDHVIRNDGSIYPIRQYINNNIKNWNDDRFYM